MTDNDNYKNRQLKLLQENLSSIRKIAGWSAEDLGDKIGVTKQTISNLENGKTPITKTHYIAIRAVLDYEMESNKENTILPMVVEILLDKSDDLNEESYNEIKATISAVSSAAAGGASNAILDGLFKSSSIGALVGLGAVPIVGGLVAASVGILAGMGAIPWLKKILQDDQKKKSNSINNNNMKKIVY